MLDFSYHRKTQDFIRWESIVTGRFSDGSTLLALNDGQRAPINNLEELELN